MSSKQTSTVPGLGFLSLLGLLFIALKLTGNITWSWWWVLAPIWVPILFALLLILLGKGLMAIGRSLNRDKRVNQPKSRWQERLEEMQAAKRNSN